ncbi:MAG: caspase family protein [Bacteroides sp.]|nr:caspase family protein [Bacteroides sp.]
MTFNVKQFRLLVICLLFFAGYTSVYAQTLHALVVGADKDTSIGKGISRNLSNLNKLIQEVAGVLDCEFEHEQYYDKDCTKEKVTEWINNLDVSPDDVVFFVYSGHGGRALNDSDIFPQMCMNRPGVQSLYMPVTHVEKLIAKKNPRLTIIITECCNSESRGIKIKPFFAMSDDEYTSASTYDKKALRDLFFNSKGIVKMSSSKPTEYSWIVNTEGAGGGGVFINHFIDTFNDAVKYNKIAASWEDIFKKVHDDVYAVQIPYQGNIYHQEPIAKISSSKGNDRKIDEVEQKHTGTLYETLKYLVNKNISVDSRLSKLSEVKERHFTSDAMVATVAANGTTIVEYEQVDNFLKRIVLSPYIKQISILSGDNQGKNSLIKVHELRD